MRFLYKIATFTLFNSYLLPSFFLLSTIPQRKSLSTETPCAISCQAALSQPQTIWDVSCVDTSRIQHGRKLIALTFDDAPASTIDPILKVFLDFNVTHADAPATATLFCNGKNVTSAARTSLQTAFAVGFELGNHTQHHYNLPCLSGSEIQTEIEQTDAILKAFDGKPTHLLRAPYGNVNDSVRQAAKTPIISWFIDTLDWTGRSPEDIYTTVWENKFSGCIVLMHDGYLGTVEALARLLPDLYEAGYQVVTVSQMAKAHNCPLKIGSVYTRARKK